jgi:hypothetical protein
MSADPSRLSLRRRFIYLAWFVLHFGLIAAISCREIVGFVEHRLTILPGGSVGAVKKIEPLISAATGESLASTNPVRRALFSYFILTGIDCSYGYFANVPGRNKLVFELRYPDGKVEYALPSVKSKAAALRVVSLLDEIGLAELDCCREDLIRQAARAVWREHPSALSIHAIFGISLPPTITEFEQGKRESFKVLYAYNFFRQENSAASKEEP